MTQIRFKKTEYLNIGGQPLAGTSFVNWMKVLIENKFAIDWQFIPKALYVTLMILVFTPFRLYEQIKYKQVIANTSISTPVFIIGHWRSGTTFLHYLMGQDPYLTYVSTFETMTPWICITNERLFKGIVKNHLPSKRPMDDLELDASLPYEEEYAVANLSPYSFYHGWYFPRRINTYFDRDVLFDKNSHQALHTWKQTYQFLLKKISYKHPDKPILIKSLVNTAKIKTLVEMFPNAKFIHIYRNPYKTYLSTCKLYEKILPLFSFHHITSKHLDQSLLRIYKDLYQKYLSDKHLIPSKNLVELRYEDFIKNPIQSLQSIYTQFGFDWFNDAKPRFEKYVEKHKNYHPDSYKLTKETKNKIASQWSFAFQAFGYDPEDLSEFTLTDL